MLDEVMVVAYGTAKKSSFTGSASTISNEKLELRPITNLTKGLEGQATGLLTTCLLYTSQLRHNLSSLHYK